VFAYEFLYLLRERGRGRARQQVVQRDHRVRLAAAETRLEVDDRCCALTREPFDRLAEKPAQPGGEERALEERDRVPVLREALADRDLV